MLDADGDSVGQERGLVGNSEVGHMNLGGLQLVPQLSYEITASAATKYHNVTGSQLYDPATLFRDRQSDTIHLIGLFSTGTIHSDQRHWLGAILSAYESGFQNIVLHLISDGRDSHRESLVATWEEFTQKFSAELESVRQNIVLGSLGGRYYGMDRDQNEDRIQKYVEALTRSNRSKAVDWGQVSPTLQSIAKESYAAGVYDENIVPRNLGTAIEENDVVWLINFRADRMKQLTAALIERNKTKTNENIVMANNNYGIEIEYLVSEPENIVLESKNSVYYPLFNKTTVQNTFADYCEEHQNTVLHIAETEKFAHVTYFFNGGRKDPYPREKFHIIPSNKVASHAEKPAMKAVEITDYILQHGLGYYDYVVVNYANADMVGHTGNLKASQDSLRVLDEQIERLYNSVLNLNGALLITADHGNVESVGDIGHGGFDTEHNANPVPCILIKNGFEATEVAQNMARIIDTQKLDLTPYTPPQNALEIALQNSVEFEEWFDNYVQTYPLWVAGLLVLSL